MDKQEKIVCAAMFVKWKYKDIDFKNEEIICGVDHNLIRKSSHFMDRRYNYDREYFSFEKGFITSKNRFVDAKEAMEIAVKAKQVGLIEEKTVEIRMLMNTGFSTQAKISQKLLDDWINLFLQEELKPEDLY